MELRPFRIELIPVFEDKEIDIDEFRRALGLTEPCEMCEDKEAFIGTRFVGQKMKIVMVNYCPACGRRL